MAVGFAIIPLSLLVTGEREINSKLALAVAMMTGICAVPRRAYRAGNRIHRVALPPRQTHAPR